MLRDLFFGRSASLRLAVPLSTVLFAWPVLAAPPIGVTAALRGEVVRTASFEKAAAIGQMSSGQQVFLGDDIKVGRQGRLQVMLLDETIFTLGANTVMRIDAFVYDPNDATKNNLATSIKQGAFRFVSGQVAKRDDNAMTVKLPSATIGVRGTSVAGEVGADGSAQVILLGPAANNNLGLPAGAINVANAAGVVDVTRPGFVTQIATANAPPAPPQQATAAQIRQLEQALSEDAVSELAEGLGVESSEIIVEEGTDSDGDGLPDQYSANENLSEAILAATGSDGGVTSDAQLIDQVAQTLFGAALGTLTGEERADMMRGTNLGEDIGNLLAGDFDYLGPTTLDDLAAFGPTGSVTFTGENAIMTDLNDETVGTFSLTQIWDFASDTVSSAIDGNFDMSAGTIGRVAGTFNPNEVQSVRFDEAQGGAMVAFENNFSSYLGGTIDSSASAMVGGQIGDRDGNITIDGTAYIYHSPGATLPTDDTMSVHTHVETPHNVSSFTELSTATQSALQGASSETGYQVNVMVNSFLSNVDRKDGTSPTASVGEGMVSIRLSQDPMSEGVDPTLINEAKGSIFAMKRTVSE